MSRFPAGKSPGSSEAHNRLLKDTLILLGSHPDFRVWRNEVGAYERDGKWIRYGLLGSADILGIVRGGIFIAVEIKTGQSTQTEQQKNFEAMIKLFGGRYYVVRSIEDVKRIIGGPRVGTDSTCP